MALQPKIIACGNTIATFAMGVRFLIGPAVMVGASLAVGLKGTLLHVAIVQVVNFTIESEVKCFFLPTNLLCVEFNRLLCLKELSLLCLLKNTMSIQIYLARGEFLLSRIFLCANDLYNATIH